MEFLAIVLVLVVACLLVVLFIKYPESTHRKIDNWRRGRSGVEYIESYVSPKHSDKYYTNRGRGREEDNNGDCGEYYGCLIKKISTGVYQIRYYC